MAFCNNGRKIVRFMVLSLYLWTFMGLFTTVFANVNRSNIHANIHGKKPAIRFRTLSTHMPTSFTYNPLEQSPTVLDRTSMRPRKRILNTEITPRHKLPNSVRQKVKNLLNSRLNNVIVAERQSIRLVCNSPFTRSIRTKYPNTQFIWSHNNRWIHPDGVKYVVMNGNLLINNTNPAIDQGVYMCHLISLEKWRLTLALYALSVSPVVTVYRTFSGSNLELFCDSQTLGRLYRGSTRKWSHNGSVVAHLNRIDARLDTTDRVPNVQMNQSGLWTCSVMRGDKSNRYWQTNLIMVEVCPAPSWWRTMVYRFPLPIVAESFSFSLFLFSLFLCAVATMKRIKQDSRQYVSLTDCDQNPIFNGDSIVGKVSIPKHRSKRRGETNEPLPASIRVAALKNLRRSKLELTIMASEGFSLRCHNNVTKLIYEKFPMADLFWEFNSLPLRTDPSRTWYRPLSNELTIFAAQAKETGVYVCKMAQNWYWEQVVAFFVIQVESSEPTISPREREALTLSCNSEVLYEIFPGIQRTWYHDQTKVFSGTGTEGEKLLLDHVKPTDKGIWTCEIKANGKKWLTSKVNVSVLPPIPIFELIQSRASYMVGVIVFLFIGCISLFLCCFALAYRGDQQDRQERLYFAEQLKLLK